ncbi:telomerase reverse transcriptase [Rhinatrema bivittatum]|uniref:telomerase reverse transcriptase n=1 Tax=Rhinatrema bivittatum TaxID=194408 RepID=UPI00112CEBC4|nr:telomerase reverse transcriptase [Rhinatrema bivittatum]
MADPERFGGVWRLLRSLYRHAVGIIAFMQRMKVDLLQMSDSAAYRRFLARLVVCVPHGIKPLPQPISFPTLSTQRELVARVIQKICEKRKKNVLAFGYALIDEKSSLHVMFAPNICNYSPNTTTATISTSALWEILLSRIGDDMMMYLLEHCSLFMLVPSSCCYQISGQPIYNFSSDKSLSSPWVKQLLRRQYNILFQYVQKKVKFHKRCLLKANWRHKQRLQTNTIRTGSQSTKEILGSVFTNPQCEAEMATNQQTLGTVNQDLMVIEHLGDQIETDLRTTAWVRSGKRHYDGATLDVPIKRRKRNLSENEELKPTSSLAKIKQKSENAHDVLSAISVEKTLTDKKSVIKGNGDQEIWGEHSLQEVDSISAQLIKGNAPDSGGRHVDIKTKQTEGISLQHRLLGKTSTKTYCKLQSESSSSPICIERGYMLFCGRSLKEDFPQSFLLNSLKRCCAGGQRLIETIFLNCNVFEQKSSKKLHNYWKKKKLPKRYWQMKHVFQDLIHYHKKCPYRIILRKNCPAWVSEVNVNRDCVQPQARSRTFHQLAPNEAEERFKPEKENNGTEPLVGEIHNPSEKETCSLELSVSVPISDIANLNQNGKERQIRSSNDVDNSDFLVFLRQHNSIQQVYAFVRECLHRVVPDKLWGSSHNKCRFLKNVKKLISMGKYDRLSLQELMWKMRVKDCSWLRLNKGNHFVPASEHQLQEGILAKFLYWLMNTYVVQLLRSFFYITETMYQKNMLFFYRKSVWSKIQKIGLRKHFAKAKLRMISAKEVEAIQGQKSIPVTSRLRFIPKQDGLRPIVKTNSSVGAKNYSKESQEKKVQHFNTRLKNLFSVLNYERMNRSSLLGSSVFGLDDIYRLWKQFALKVQETNAEIPCFYFVKTDVAGAYDTIPLDKLEDVVSNIIAPKEENRYCIRRYATVWRDSNGHIRKSYKRHVSTMCDLLPNMKQFVSCLQKSFGLQNTILVEQSLSLNEISSRLFSFFQQIIHNNILEIDNQYYVQCCGIPQGSILSALLCSFCYGDMENKLFYAIQQDGILLRLIDDFLLVTPHLMQAKLFLRTLAKGIPEYGCSISPHKTMVNFQIDEDLPGCNKAKQIPSCSLFPWCGLLLDTKTLEVYCDYSSYAGTSIRSSLTFNYSATAGKSMRDKLIAILKLKCHSIFLDLMVNRLQTVYTNIYKIFLLQAYRFHACVVQLPFNQSVKGNPSFFLTVIADMSSCCYSILKAKNKGIVLGARDASGPFPFEATQWLCLQAFIIKLTNHKSVYNHLLKPLKNCEFQVNEENT